jgi:hypothetical protein
MFFSPLIRSTIRRALPDRTIQLCRQLSNQLLGFSSKAFWHTHMNDDMKRSWTTSSIDGWRPFSRKRQDTPRLGASRNLYLIRRTIEHLDGHLASKGSDGVVHEQMRDEIWPMAFEPIVRLDLNIHV